MTNKVAGGYTGGECLLGSCLSTTSHPTDAWKKSRGRFSTNRTRIDSLRATSGGLSTRD